MIETMLLPVALTEEEVAVEARNLAAKVDEFAHEEIARKAEAAESKRRIDAIKADIQAIAIKVRTKKENRPVEIDRVRNEERATIETVRKDTGEVVGVRPMTESERTRPLPFEAKKDEIA